MRTDWCRLLVWACGFAFFCTAARVEAVSLSLNTDWHNQFVPPGSQVSVTVTLDTEGTIGFTDIAFMVLFDGF